MSDCRSSIAVGCLVWAACWAGGQFAVADEPRVVDSSIEEAASPELAPLGWYIGAWKLKEHHFDQQGHAIATVKGSEEIVWILDKNAIVRRYRTSTGTTNYLARGLLTWNAVEKRYKGIWLDSVSTTGPNSVNGTWDAEKRIMTFELTATDTSGKVSTYRIIEEFTDEENRIATTYRMQGDVVQKIMSVEYTRAAPCPAVQSARTIGGY